MHLRDAATVVVPARTVDEFTGEPGRVDWKAEPAAEHDVAFRGQPIIVRGVDLQEDTVLARWRGYLGPNIQTADDPPTLVAAEAVVTPACRIRWHGVTYAIEGDVGVHRRGQTTRYLSVTLRRVDTT